MSTLAQRFTDFAASLQFERLPGAVVHEVKRRVLDSIGCAFGSWRDEPCVIARRVASQVTGSPGSTVFGTRHASSIDWAAFANGCMVRYLDYNDTYLSKEPAHPSDNIPAALAVAEAHRRPGRDLIAAIALAYEVQCRLCDAVSIRARGWDHVTYGTFSVALAAAKLMNLPSEKIRHAVGIAGVASANLRQSRCGELSHWKGCAFAGAARQGVFAAMLAAEGMTGPAPIFEGTCGFEKLVSGPLDVKGPFAEGSTKFDLADLMILKTSIKFWPVEYHAQSAVEASLELGKQAKVADIAAVHIESHDASVDIIGTGEERWKPTSRETADHSLPYLVAVTLTDGEVTPKQFDRERFTDPKLLEFLSRVTVARNAELSRNYPGEVGNIITLKLKDGRTLTKRLDVPSGNARKPLTDAQVAKKYHTMADPMIGARRADQLADWVWHLENQKDMSELMKLAVVE